MQVTLRSLTRDFRFWLLLFTAVRLYGITFPPLESNHTWRQTFTCMVARNFLEEDPNLFTPRTDLAGFGPDAVAAEFPVFNYLIFLAAKLFGYGHWYGRIINLVVSSLGIWCFFLLARRFFGERIALSAGIILVCSEWFMFSRKIMPDTFSASLALAGLWFLVRYADTGKPGRLVLFVVLSALGGLSKIPSVMITATGLILFFDKTIPRGRRIHLLAGLILAFVPVAAWYFIRVPRMLAENGNALYFPRGLRQGLSELWDHRAETLERFTFISLRSYVALACLLAGGYMAIRHRDRILGALLAITLPLLAGFMIRAGFVFATHDYYIIPFVPVMALLAGYGLSNLGTGTLRYARIILVVIAIEGIANQMHDFRVNPGKVHLLKLEAVADSLCPRQEKIAITGGMNPEEMYFVHRKGRGVTDEEMRQPGLPAELAGQGYRLLFADRRKHPPIAGLTVVYRDAHYLVYRLR
ncbi:MAG TPA: glycosyltransferase family 39 protein [Bacteroidales bacterium]|nr:glycosyltransferase family 39 protein [Bacteroidales bacterium]